MANFDFDAVVKIGSMALIRKEDNDIDYNIISRLARELKPGYILVSSGATEIGRLDYMKRNGSELKGDIEEIKTDYSAQGQSILMQEYRRFINPKYSVRQVLVEHSHFNDHEKSEHIKKVLFRAANQNAIPIINYNDPVSNKENMKMEIASLRTVSHEVVECVDNDETASVIAQLVNAKLLVILSSVDGIYQDPYDSATIINEITGKTPEEVFKKIDTYMECCVGSSRKGTMGAKAKLLYAKNPVKAGSTVIIANAKYKLSDIIAGNVARTIIKLEDAKYE